MSRSKWYRSKSFFAMLLGALGAALAAFAKVLTNHMNNRKGGGRRKVKVVK